MMVKSYYEKLTPGVVHSTLSNRGENLKRVKAEALINFIITQSLKAVTFSLIAGGIVGPSVIAHDIASDYSGDSSTQGVFSLLTYFVC